MLGTIQMYALGPIERSRSVGKLIVINTFFLLLERTSSKYKYTYSVKSTTQASLMNSKKITSMLTPRAAEISTDRGIRSECRLYVPKLDDYTWKIAGHLGVIKLDIALVHVHVYLRFEMEFV